MIAFVPGSDPWRARSSIPSTLNFTLIFNSFEFEGVLKGISYRRGIEFPREVHEDSSHFAKIVLTYCPVRISDNLIQPEK